MVTPKQQPSVTDSFRHHIEAFRSIDNESDNAMNHKVPNDGSTLPYRILEQGQNHKLPGENDTVDNAGVGEGQIKWCTMDCEQANWPKDNIDGAKSCRTFNAIYCATLEQHVTRNTPCAVEHGARRPKPNW
ncbi:MAG TPA: hypothetical protein ENH10_01450 [Bacteroidetes bacterium]|nr:hypothetical protein BMS3Bbin04_01539 [bacterium BMS3Bbin04]HDO64686.1 hypothetical protein [Bacteroidota bacterium]HEX03811.1 hypothetical protein [Bacteroidota bacterium]